jgi:hypothetical protein
MWADLGWRSPERRAQQKKKDAGELLRLRESLRKESEEALREIPPEPPSEALLERRRLTREMLWYPDIFVVYGRL